MHTDGSYQRAPITNLEHNTFYYFRIVPLLRDPEGNLNKGEHSAVGGAYRTKCISPDAPTIEDISSGLDESVNPPQVVLTVKWKVRDRYLNIEVSR